LKRILRLFTLMATSESSICRQSIVVSDELHAFMLHWMGDTSDELKICSLVDFFVAESAPGDVLRAFVCWSNSHELGSAVFYRLHNILRRGVHDALQSGLSGSLLRLKHARRMFEEEDDSLAAEEPIDFVSKSDGLWRRMSAGGLSIDK
jgi:hypothetical protein